MSTDITDADLKRRGLGKGNEVRGIHRATHPNIPVNGALNSQANKDQSLGEGYAQCHHLAFYVIRFLIVEYANSNGSSEATQRVTELISHLFGEMGKLATIGARVAAKNQFKKAEELLKEAQEALKKPAKTKEVVLTKISALLNLLNKAIPNLLIGDQYINRHVSYRVDPRIELNGGGNGCVSLTDETKELLLYLQADETLRQFAIIPVTHEHGYVVSSTFFVDNHAVKRRFSVNSEQILKMMEDEGRLQGVVKTPPGSPRASSSGH